MRGNDNILIVTSSPIYRSCASSNFLKLLYKGFREEKKEIKILLQRNYSINQDLPDFITKSNIINVSPIKNPNNFILKLLDRFLGVVLLPYFIIKFSVREKQIVLFYNDYFYEIILGWIAAFLLKSKTFSFSVDQYLREDFKGILGLLKWNNYWLKERFLNKHLDGIIVFSSFMETLLKEIGVPKTKILRIYNMVDPYHIDILNNYAIQDLKNRTFVLGYAGTPTEKDGINTLLNAIAKIKQKNNFKIILKIAGDNIEKSLIPSLRLKVQELKIEDSIEFLGLLPSSSIPSFLSTCDALILIRPDTNKTKYGFPTKLGEYFVSKRPVLLSPVGDFITEFEDEKEVLFINSAESVESKIAKLINNDQLYKRLVMNGYNWMERKQDYRNVILLIINFIK